MNNLMTRRRALMDTERKTPDPLYPLTNGRWKVQPTSNDDNFVGNVGDLTVSNGNHIYYRKVFGDNAQYYVQNCSHWSDGVAPFALQAGDKVKCVITPSSASSGQTFYVMIGDGVRIPNLRIGTASTVQTEVTTTIQSSYNNPWILSRPDKNTSNLVYDFDVEIYVNDVRYI